jgi:hypothetical protein
MPLFQKNGIWYWSPDDNPLTVTNPAALYASTGLPISGLPPTSDVVCPRSITYTLGGSPGVAITVVEDGGNLDFSLNVDTTDPKKGDLSGLFFDFTNSKLSTLSVSGPQITEFMTQAGGVMNLRNGVNLNGLHLPNFDVGMEFGLAGIGSNHQNIQSESFVLSDTAHDLSINDLHPAGETGNIGVRTLSVGQKLAAVAPYAPTATPDTVTTLEDKSITIQASALATDKNSGAVVKISEIGTGAEGPQYGTVQIAPDGKSLTYTPTTLDYEVNGILTGNRDAFQVCVTDNFGGEVTSFVTVNATPVADTPTVKVQVLAPHAGDPITEVRLLVTSQSGDFGTVNQGSDSIQSIGLNLSGIAANQITDSLGLLSGNTINASSNQGFFQDEVDLLMPADTTLSDSLAVTATAAETEGTGSPATASATANQSIVLDNAQLSQNLDFQTSRQSIWDSGAAFSKDFNTGFLGIDTSFSTSQSVAVASAGASVHFRAGVQADLKISAGDISATLPFNVGLDSTYNVTTDTLQIMPTDAELGGGHFTAHGPSGSFTFGLDLGLKAAAHATLLGAGPSPNFTVGSFTSPVFSTGLNSTQLSHTFDLPGGFSLTLAFPNVNTNGSNGSPGTISGTGVSNDIVNFSADLVAVASDIIFHKDVTDASLALGDTTLGSIDVLDLILGIGLDVVQKFNLSTSGLVPVLKLEDGTLEPLSFGAPLTIPDASSHDIDHDGKISFSLGLVPSATLTNNTSLGASLNAGITALALSVSHIGSFTAYKNSTTVQLGTFPPLYSNSFALNGFGSQTVTQTV